MSCVNVPHQGRPARKPIILIGAPSGAGKTMLSRKIMSGELPILDDLLPSLSEQQIARHDLKSLPSELCENTVCIIECATHNFKDLCASNQWQRVLPILGESELVVHLTFRVSKKIVLLQYIKRIFQQPQQMHPVIRALQLSKYRNALVYLLTRQLDRAGEDWASFGEELARQMGPQIIVAEIERHGAGYRLFIHRCPRALHNAVEDEVLA